MFFASMSVISRSMLASRMIVGAKTTARFLGVIFGTLVNVPFNQVRQRTKFSLSLTATRAK